MSVARVWKSTLLSLSKAVEHNWHGSSSSGFEREFARGGQGELTAQITKPPCSLFQLVLSEFEAQSKVAKVPSDKHCMGAPGAIFLISPNETSHPNSEVTSHKHGMRKPGACFFIEMRE